jgi:hypothetical protein
MLPTTGPISFSEIQRVLGGEKPVSLSRYFANANGAPATAGTPGPIPVSALRGKAKQTTTK